MPKPELSRAPSIGVRSRARRTLRPFAVEVVDQPVVRLESIDREIATAEPQAAEQDVAIPGDIAVGEVVALEQQLERVAGLNVALKIHGIGKGADHRDQNGVRHAGLAGVRRQARLDDARRSDRPGFQLGVEFDRGKAAVRVALNQDLAFHRRAELQSRQDSVMAGMLEDDGQFLADLQIPRVIHRLQDIDQGMGLGARGAGTAENRQQRVAAFHRNRALFGADPIIFFQQAVGDAQGKDALNRRFRRVQFADRLCGRRDDELGDRFGCRVRNVGSGAVTTSTEGPAPGAVGREVEVEGGIGQLRRVGGILRLHLRGESVIENEIAATVAIAVVH